MQWKTPSVEPYTRQDKQLKTSSFCFVYFSPTSVWKEKEFTLLKRPMKHSENRARMLAIARSYNEEILSVTKSTQIQHVVHTGSARVEFPRLRVGSRVFRGFPVQSQGAAQWDQKWPSYFLDFGCLGCYFWTVSLTHSLILFVPSWVEHEATNWTVSVGYNSKQVLFCLAPIKPQWTTF